MVRPHAIGLRFQSQSHLIIYRGQNCKYMYMLKPCRNALLLVLQESYCGSRVGLYPYNSKSGINVDENRVMCTPVVMIITVVTSIFSTRCSQRVWRNANCQCLWCVAWLHGRPQVAIAGAWLVIDHGRGFISRRVFQSGWWFSPIMLIDSGRIFLFSFAHLN